MQLAPSKAVRSQGASQTTQSQGSPQSSSQKKKSPEDIKVTGGNVEREKVKGADLSEVVLMKIPALEEKVDLSSLFISGFK